MQQQPIRTDEIYPLAEFLRRMGMSRTAYRTAKRNGLRVVRTAGRAFVRGADWDRYLKGLTDDKPNNRRIGFQTP